eukprot:498607_1
MNSITVLNPFSRNPFGTVPHVMNRTNHAFHLKKSSHHDRLNETLDNDIPSGRLNKALNRDHTGHLNKALNTTLHCELPSGCLNKALNRDHTGYPSGNLNEKLHRDTRYSSGHLNNSLASASHRNNARENRFGMRTMSREIVQNNKNPKKKGTKRKFTPLTPVNALAIHNVCVVRVCLVV